MRTTVYSFNCTTAELSDAKMCKQLVDNPRAVERTKKPHPMGWLGTAKKIAKLVFFL